MEITVQLPIHEWYEHTEHNDLLYWGLDYPPLSAYFSFVAGKMFERSFLVCTTAHRNRLQIFDPPSVELFSSRGHVTLWSKLLMRISVLLCDVLLATGLWSFVTLKYKGDRVSSL